MLLSVRPLGGLFTSEVTCVFSSRHQQNMSLSYGDTHGSIENRRVFLGGLGLDYRDIVCAKQIHSSSVKYATEKDAGSGALSYESAIADTDGLVTDRRNLALAIFTADCLSIFLYDPQTPAIGLIHAGWGSTKENIALETVRLMQREFNSRAQNLYAGFGPAIRNCCYEVGKDFQDTFGSLENRGGRYYLDLIALNRKQLLDSGLAEKNIFDCGVCTSCRNADFFSFRKEGVTCGRQISVIMLK